MARSHATRPLTAAERMRRYRARRHEAGLRAVTRWTSGEPRWSDAARMERAPRPAGGGSAGARHRTGRVSASLRRSPRCSPTPSVGACMTRSELEHLIGVAGEISEDREIVVIGGQAILGQYPDAPAALLRSMEADVFPRNHPGAPT